jgi:ABC-type multidrug transport system fused ATPase/permease subunit
MSAIEVSDKEEIDFNYNFRVYFGFLKKYKWGCFFLVGLAFFISSLDLVFTYAFSHIVQDATDYLHRQISLEALQNRLWPVFAALLAVPFARGIGRWQYLGSINRLESRLIADIKRYFFDHLLALSHGFHTSHKTGSLISRLSRGSGAVETMTDVIIFQYVPVFFQLSLVSTSIFIFTRPVGLTVLAVVLVYLGFSLYVTRKQQRANALYNNMSDIEKANISDVFTNIESIKYFAKEGDVRGRFFDISEKTRELQLGFWDQYKWLEGGQLFIIGTGTFVLVYLSLRSVLDGSMGILAFVFVVTTFGTLVQPLSGFVMGIRNMYRAVADFEDLFQYGKIENEIKDRPGAKPLRVARGAIEFKDLVFQYKKRHILFGFSLKVPAHRKVAVVGPSGAGKTTLIRLLYRLYDLESGAITIDGADIAQATQTTLRDSLSMVPQECILFDDSIYNNIAFSNPKATREAVFSAIRCAQLEKFIAGLPLKEKTIVGERGVKLSGGEKQRVSIARALLADKRILILDEATSSLDSQTEHEIQKGLKDLMKGRTSILIAHRLSTIMSADIIVVLDKGRVVQQGKHRELIRKPGLYKKLWNLQKGGYID